MSERRYVLEGYHYKWGTVYLGPKYELVDNIKSAWVFNFGQHVGDRRSLMNAKAASTGVWWEAKFLGIFAEEGSLLKPPPPSPRRIR